MVEGPRKKTEIYDLIYGMFHFWVFFGQKTRKNSHKNAIEEKDV